MYIIAHIWRNVLLLMLVPYSKVLSSAVFYCFPSYCLWMLHKGRLFRWVKFTSLGIMTLYPFDIFRHSYLTHGKIVCYIISHIVCVWYCYTKPSCYQEVSSQTFLVFNHGVVRPVPDLLSVWDVRSEFNGLYINRPRFTVWLSHR